MVRAAQYVRGCGHPRAIAHTPKHDRHRVVSERKPHEEACGISEHPGEWQRLESKVCAEMVARSVH